MLFVFLPRHLSLYYIDMCSFRHGKEYVKDRFPRLEELFLDHNKLVEDELFIHLSSLKKWDTNWTEKRVHDSVLFQFETPAFTTQSNPNHSIFESSSRSTDRSRVLENGLEAQAKINSYVIVDTSSLWSVTILFGRKFLDELLSARSSE